MARPRGVTEIHKRKRMTRLGQPDHLSYCHSDSGCKWATDYLGFQSLCLACPFEEGCKLDRNVKWNG